MMHLARPYCLAPELFSWICSWTLAYLRNTVKNVRMERTYYFIGQAERSGFMPIPIAWSEIQSILMSVVFAVLILIVGWIVVKAITSSVNKLLSNNRFFQEKMTSQLGEDRTQSTVNLITKLIYYILMLFVLIAVLQALNLSVVTEPLNRLLSVIFAYLPQLFGAVVLLFIAWFIATILKQAILTLFGKTKIDERLGEEIEVQDENVKLSTTIAELACWTVFILFLPAILGTLSLDGLLTPIQNMVNAVLMFLPKLFSAAVILLIGWFIAIFCKKLVTIFLKAVKVDDFGSKSGLTTEEPGRSLSELLGMAVYVIILIPIVISALNVLNIDSIAQPATDMLGIIFTFIPVLFSAFIIVAFAYFIGKMVGELASSLLGKLGFNRVLPLIGIKAERIDLSRLAGQLIMILIVLVAAMEAANLLGFGRLSDLITEFIVLAGNVLVGLVIIGVGLYVGNLVAELIEKSEVKNARTLGLAAKISLLVLTITMGLSQMGLASEIITLAFIFLAGALAISFAIAFGIGGRDLAAKKLSEIDEKMKKND